MAEHSIRDGVEGKICPRCQGWVELSGYSKNKSARDWLDWWCKKCRSEVGAAYYRRGKKAWVHCVECGRNRVHHSHGLCHQCYNRLWGEANKERVAITKKRWKEANPDRAKEYSRRKREAHPDYNRQYYEKNKERLFQQRESKREELNAASRQWKRDHKEQCRHYMEINREKYRKYATQYYQEHKEEIKKRVVQWQHENPDRYRANRHLRRAREAGATVGFVNIDEIYERDKVCIYCGTDKDLSIDHLIPLSRGGIHCQENLVVACRSCNSKKGTMTYEEFCDRHQIEIRGP